MKVLTEAQMREIDRVTIEERGVPGLTLMERAGQAVADLILDRWHPNRVAVCTGKGNNAGDGFVVARLLSEQGVEVDLHLGVAPDPLRGDAATNFELLPSNVRQIDDPQAESLRSSGGEAGVIVDAVLGTGVKGTVSGSPAEMVRAINAVEGVPIVAVDVPSGCSAENLAGGGECVRADVTVTFGWPKLPMVLHPGATHVGELVVADIGFPPELVQTDAHDVNLTDAEVVRAMMPARPPDSHKGTFGHLLIIAGSHGMGGAGALAGRAAVRSGAGLVTVATPECCVAGVETLVLSAIKWPLRSASTSYLDESALDQLTERLDEFDAVALGPGLGPAPETHHFVHALVRRVKSPLIIDADGLNALEGESELLKQRPGATVLTPHPKEMSRLSGQSVDEILADRVGAARRFAADHGVVVILKGARTVIANPDMDPWIQGETWINPSGNTGLAKGGSGDVLTGLIGGLAAQDMGPLEAAVAGVHWHGLAADVVAEEIPEQAMTPDDVIEALPEALWQIRGGGPEDLGRL